MLKHFLASNNLKRVITLGEKQIYYLQPWRPQPMTQAPKAKEIMSCVLCTSAKYVENSHSSISQALVLNTLGPLGAEFLSIRRP